MGKNAGNAATEVKKERKPRTVKKFDWAQTPYGVFFGDKGGCRAAFANPEGVQEYISGLSPKKLKSVFLAQVAKVEVEMKVTVPGIK